MDNHATTPLDPRVLEEMLPYFTKEFGNASSIDHIYSNRAAEAVEKARDQVASIINAKPEEIIFTSGATEANNLAIQGIAKAYQDKGRHIITCTTEHKAVLEPCKHLENLGWKVTYIPVDQYGIIDLEKLTEAITKDTILISVMFANNEIGTIAPVKEIGRIAHENEIFYHTDAAQAVGHVPIDVEDMNIDTMSISAHKIYGPKGVGGLYIRRYAPKVKLSPIIYGGGQEKTLRPGTLNVPSIVGMGSSLNIAAREMNEEKIRLKSLTELMRRKFLQVIKGSEQNGHPTQRLPHNLNIYIKNVENKALIQSVSSEIAISSSSACTTTEIEPSHVILALGYDNKRAHSSIRFGLGRFNTKKEVTFVISHIIDKVAHLRRMTF